ncbi:transglycosylase domain-containing protein [Cognatishimia sp. D5M38]|uniref:Transglycosylase domain-containing protein n=1 Tax=Cognatishimia coralii TaxID=3083254 RepID=A0ABU8QL48_9RHOB
MLTSKDQIRQLYEEATANQNTLPALVLQAFIAGEDRNFYQRPISRSVITQHVSIRHLPPSSGRLQQLALAILIGRELSHEEVVEWFVSQVFLGQSCFGVSNAAAAYFGTTVGELKLEEAAYLAALPKAPLRFHPVESYERAVERRNLVLKEMLKAGFISSEEAKRAIQSELKVIVPLARCEGDQ